MNRLLLVLVGLTVCSAGCVHHHHHGAATSPGSRDVVVVHEPGPPPHAPAHGHRVRHHHHPDVELVFDSNLGLYVVVGIEDVFFHHDHFYRAIHGAWHRSVRPDRGWVLIQTAKLPPGLAKKQRHQSKHKKKHRRHPAKYGD